MTPVHFDGQTAVLSAPTNWNEETHGPCVGLPVRREDDIMFMSCWRPTWRERLWLLFGGVVRLWVVGDGHPPVMLEAGSGKGARR